MTLARPPPAAAQALPVRFVVESGRTRAGGAVIRDSTFEHSCALMGRWKSSGSTIANNTFRRIKGALLEAQLIGAFYEGPILVDNVRIENNTFELEEGPAPIAAALVVARNWSTGIELRGNRVTAP